MKPLAWEPPYASYEALKSKKGGGQVCASVKSVQTKLDFQQ